MKKQGAKKTKTKIAGHQKCGLCHPETKAGRSSEKAELERQLQEAIQERDSARESLKTAQANIADALLIRGETESEHELSAKTLLQDVAYACRKLAPMTDEVLTVIYPLVNERDELKRVLSKSPVEICQEERKAGNGGCGSCALCCKELRDGLETAYFRLLQLKEHLTEHAYQELESVLHDWRPHEPM